MTDAELQSYCYEWVNWCNTRKFYMAPTSKNILARMQPSKTGREPNAANDPFMQFFNMAVHTLSDMPQHKDAYMSFKLFYLVDNPCLKREIAAMKIDRSTYYRRKDAFARAVYSMALSLQQADRAMREMEANAVALKRDKITISRRDKQP